MIRYLSTETMDGQMLGYFTFLSSFGYEEDGQWYVDDSVLKQIDLSGDINDTVEDACQNLYGQSKAQVFLIDPAYQLYQVGITKAQLGQDILLKMFGNINSVGGLPGYLDDHQLPFFNSLTSFGFALYTGSFEYAMRLWYNDLKATSPLSAEQETLFFGWIEQSALQTGTPQQTIDLIKTVPKGQYPFGAVGEP